MKAVLLLFVVASCYALPTPDEWEDYKLKFNKSYPDPMIDDLRKTIYLNNVERVKEHNERYEKGEVSWQMGINQFSDLTHNERTRPCLLTEGSSSPDKKST